MHFRELVNTRIAKYRAANYASVPKMQDPFGIPILDHNMIRNLGLLCFSCCLCSGKHSKNLEYTHFMIQFQYINGSKWVKNINLDRFISQNWAKIDIHCTQMVRKCFYAICIMNIPFKCHIACILANEYQKM